MKINSYITLSVERDERVYQFLIPQGAPYGETYDVVFSLLNQVRKLSEQAAEKVKCAHVRKEDDGNK